MSLIESAIEQMNEDRLKIEKQINDLIDAFEQKHKGAFVKEIENSGDIGENDYKLQIEISI